MGVAALLEEPGHEGPDAVEDPPQVDAHHPVPVGLGPLPDHAGLEHAGVVAQQVHRPEPLVGGVGQGLHLRLVADVGAHPDRLGAQTGDVPHRVVERVRLDVGEHHPHAFLRRVTGQAAADATRRAGDHRHPTREVVHQRIPRKQARTSSTNRVGCSIAAKCPPRGSAAKCTRLWSRSAHRREVRMISFG